MLCVMHTHMIYIMNVPAVCIWRNLVFFLYSGSGTIEKLAIVFWSLSFIIQMYTNGLKILDDKLIVKIPQIPALIKESSMKENELKKEQEKSVQLRAECVEQQVRIAKK